MAKQPAMLAKESLLTRVRWGRFLAWLFLGCFVMAGTLLAWNRTEAFLIRDDRFRLPEAEEFGGKSPNLILKGVRYASTSQMRHIFSPDLGRSMYLVPIEQRRRQLLAIDWVEHAAVARQWPNTLRVYITERVPVAFVHLPPNRRDGLSQFALIDRDGFILRPRVPARFTLPVINGVREDEDIINRRARVRRVLSMLKDVGKLSEHISEVDVSDPNNLVVAEHMDDRVFNLILGDENYAERMNNFITHYNEIKASRPDATTLDLRVDNMITAVKGGNIVE